MLINTFVIDIYKEVWDEMMLKPKESIHIKTLSYCLSKDMNEFSSDISKLIGNRLSDNFSVNINGFEDVIFVRIDIFDREEHFFVLDYLESHGTEINYPNINLNHGGNLVRFSGVEENLLSELTTELYDKFGKKVNISRSKDIFEKGASV